MAEQEDLVQAFFNKDDVYKQMASRIYDKAVDEINKDERFVGKTTILGAGYGTVWFQAQLKTFGYDMDLDECRRVIDVYRSTNFSISRFWKRAQKAIEALQRKESSALVLTTCWSLLVRSPQFACPRAYLCVTTSWTLNQGTRALSTAIRPDVAGPYLWWKSYRERMPSCRSVYYRGTDATHC